MRSCSVAALAAVAAMALCGCSAPAGCDGPDAPAVVYDRGGPTADRCGAVGVVLQLPDYPAGCEPCSLVSILKAYGYETDVDEVMGHFPEGRDWVAGYWGSVYAVGAAYPPAVAAAADSYLSERGSNVRAVDMTGCSWGDVKRSLGLGRPVMAWTTTDGSSPVWSSTDDGPWPMYANEHCVVIAGAAGGVLRVMDPLEGIALRDEGDFAAVWEECGSMALTLE